MPTVMHVLAACFLPLTPVSAASAPLPAPAITTARDASPPALILFITVDQLRGDIATRFYGRFDEGGFRRLIDAGVFYTNAHYGHAATFTAVGHATLFSGGNPPEHGIPGNNWFDTAAGRSVYCVEDDRYPLVGEPAAATKGRSPHYLTTSTIGDELIQASAGRARVFAVGGKDRSAILPAGRLGKAFWFDGGRFVTSTYYYAAYPDWAVRWNQAEPAGQYRKTQWTLLREPGRYLRAGQDDHPCEFSEGTLGRVFPHPIDGKDDKESLASLSCTPMADELTLAFALELLEQEKLGRGPATDLLSISFSATDYVGHAFGPDSLEAEDNLYRLDRTIARLLDAVDHGVGLARTLVVLSSDHGVDSSPEYRYGLTHPLDGELPAGMHRRPDGCVEFVWDAAGVTSTDTGRHDPKKLIAAANAALRARFQINADLVTVFWNPCLYLDEAAVARLGLDLPTVERSLAGIVAGLPGFAAAYARSDILAGRLPDGPVARRVARSVHPTRSGHVFVVQSPFWFIHHKANEDAAMHGSPYNYDTHVPIIMAGPGIAAARVVDPVGPEDVAPTIAQYLGILAPSGSQGRPRAEVSCVRQPAPP